MFRSKSSIRDHNEYILAECEEGDLLEFPRTGYSHWAVYVGDGKVIHLTPTNGGNSLSSKNEKAMVKKSRFWDVVKNSQVSINNYLDGELDPFPEEEIVERAQSRLGEKGYDLLSNNCEHFATWCRYGVEYSEQTDLLERAVETTASLAEEIVTPPLKTSQALADLILG